MSVISISGLNRNQPAHAETHAEEFPQSSEGVLLAARSAMGLSPEAVAHELNLAPDQIVALERGEYDGFAGLVYLKGYLRNYAKFVGIDPDIVLAGLEETHNEPEVSIQMPAARSYTPRRRTQRRAGRIIFPIMLFGSAAVVIAAGWAVFSSQWGKDGSFNNNAQNGGISLSVAGDSERRTQGSGVSLEIVNDSGSGSASSSSGIPLSNNTQAPAQPASNNDALAATGITLQIASQDAPALGTSIANNSQTTTALPQTGETNSPAANAATTGQTPQAANTTTTEESAAPLTINPVPIEEGGLVLRGMQDSWVEISDGDNIKLFADTLKKGQILEFQSPPPFNIVLGNAEAVQVDHSGASIDVAKYTKANVSKFNIKPDGGVSPLTQ